MACILKLPSEVSKGVISFTNIEYFGQIKNRETILNFIGKLKDKWLFCYHPNWEDHAFVDDGVFDCILSVPSSFSFSKQSTGNRKLVETCSNRMSPPDFTSVSPSEKRWDFCHVSRYQTSKNIEGFFRVVKLAFANRPELTGVLIISVPDSSAMRRVRAVYESIFSSQQRRQFEFITLSYDLPFPLSKKTLAHFYNFSKVTLNTHLNEPHGRVVGYALAAGLPVVGYQPISGMVDEHDRREPVFFLTEQGDELALSEKLCLALDYVNDNYDAELHSKFAKRFSEPEQAKLLQEKLVKLFDLDNNGWNLFALDSRLSTHYIMEESSNSFPVSVFQFLAFLESHELEGAKDDESTLVNDIQRFSHEKFGFLVSVKDFFYVRLYIKKKIWLRELQRLYICRALRWFKRLVVS